MANRSIGLDGALYKYVLDVSLREPEILRKLREETATHSLAMMQVAPEQGQFLGFLAQLLNARRYLEVGVFTGYSALCVALAQERCHIMACDIDAETTRIAQRYWDQAGVAHRVQLRVAPALETLREALDIAGGGSFDLAFIDADKKAYWQYYELCLQLIRPGGVVAIDNVLWGGSVVDPEKSDVSTQAIRDFNRRLHEDQRVAITLVPIGDGLTLARKLEA